MPVKGMPQLLCRHVVGGDAPRGFSLHRPTSGVTVLGFALAMLQGMLDALVLNVTSRPRTGPPEPPGLHLDDRLATLARAEAVFGLLIEGLLITAFTRRVTGG